MSGFVVIGENIHCTRVVKLGGGHTTELPGGRAGVAFRYEQEDRVLPIPPDWGEVSGDLAGGKVRHIALAVHQAMNGAGEDRPAGEAYLLHAARRQVDAGARFLDVNVDEYSNDPDRRAEAMRWLAGFLSQGLDVPLSIDSSSRETIVAGLEAALALGARHVELRMDSELVVRQLDSRYRVRNPGLKRLFGRMKDLRWRFASFRAAAIPRADNALADKLANQALDRSGA